MKLPDEIQQVIDREIADESEPWLMYGREIEGIEVKELSLYHLHLLDGLDNTVINGGDVDEGAIAQFLWVVSKDFVLGDNKARDKFIKGIADKNTYKLRISINDYIQSALAQSKAMTSDEKEKK